MWLVPILKALAFLLLSNSLFLWEYTGEVHENDDEKEGAMK